MKTMITFGLALVACIAAASQGVAVQLITNHGIDTLYVDSSKLMVRLVSGMSEQEKNSFLSQFPFITGTIRSVDTPDSFIICAISPGDSIGSFKDSLQAFNEPVTHRYGVIAKQICQALSDRNDSWKRWGPSVSRAVSIRNRICSLSFEHT